MSVEPSIIMKAMSSRMVTKALQKFDRATTVVVGACWAAAVLIMALAVYTTILSVSAKRAANDAIAAEPVLPKIVRSNIDNRYLQLLLERLQHQFPEVVFSIEKNQSLQVSALDGSKYRQWLTALSYIDTVSPEYHWSISKFCVGKCSGEIMRAVLTGEKISFQAPQPDDKN